MHQSNPPLSVTIEEAVARMINFDYIPTHFTLLEMTAAFLEEAEVDYTNGQLDNLPKRELDLFLSRIIAAQARHDLATSLTDHLTQEIANPRCRLLAPPHDNTQSPLVVLAHVINWASDNYGIGIPVQIEGNENNNPQLISQPSWQEVTIKIYKDYKIGCTIGQGKTKRSDFHSLGLMGKRKLTPNILGGILIGLSKGMKFPNRNKPENNDKTALSKIRNSLKQMTDISSDPFYPINDADGWKPRFKLIDAQASAANRTKKQAKHESYDDRRHYDNDLAHETPGFENEDDTTGQWLKKNDRHYQ